MLLEENHQGEYQETNPDAGTRQTLNNIPIILNISCILFQFYSSCGMNNFFRFSKTVDVPVTDL